MPGTGRSTRPAPAGALPVVLLLLALAGAGCSPAGSGATGPAGSTAAGGTPLTTGNPTAAASPAPAVTTPATPRPTRVPRPSGALLLPTEFSVEIEPGRYFSMPPFEVAFTFEVAEEGWQSGHLIDEFFDLQRWDGVPEDGLPSTLAGFAHPDWFQGPAGRVPGADLSPSEAVALLLARSNLDTANEQQLRLLGQEAIRVDVHVPIENAPIFGGDDGTFSQGVDLDARYVLVQVEGELLVLVVQAAPGDLDAAWQRALPIFESVQLLD